VVAQGKAANCRSAKALSGFEQAHRHSGAGAAAQIRCLRELDISGGSLEGFGNGNLDVVGAGRAKADAVYRDLAGRLGLAGSEQSRAAYDLNARNIGINAGLAENMGAAVTSRTEGLDQLRSRLATAGTAKEVADLTARLQLESAAMQNDQLRLQAIALQQQAQERQRAAEGRLPSPKSSMKQAATTGGNELRWRSSARLLLLAGCGRSETPHGRHASQDLAILCRQPWRDRADAEDLPRMGRLKCPYDTQPAVVTTNCRAAAFAKSQLQLSQ
jgi:type IV secretion system protein VirB5